MKTHTAAFKQKIALHGKEIDSILTYELDGETIELGNDELNSITPYYEAGLLKSVMKQLDIDCNVEIPAGTIVNYQLGVKTRNDEVEDYRDNYDYVDYGNYIVKDVEKQEDSKSYKIECYDKMLLTMTDYEDLEITYPITVRNYINTLCQHLGITFANASDIFCNYDKNIIKEFYLEYNAETEEYETMGYTYRDVFDELAQVTASTIMINTNDELEIRYITDSQDTIDEEYLKDVNVNFGEQYGPVNSIVFSRSADTDFIYKQDDESIEENGLCEIKISENQILSQNNRSEFLDGVYDVLDGLTYYLNNYTSPGILYYDICDRYNVSIGETTYSCVMFNDSAEVTQGLVEKVYTERPEDSETDYSKSSKDEKTSLIVDKVNKKITAVVSEIGDRSSSQTTISQDIDDIYARLESVEEVSTEAKGDGVVTIQGLMESSVLSLKVHPNGSYDLLNRYSAQHSVIGHYHINRPVIVFYNGDISYQYELPRLYYYNNTYDEFILDNVVKKAFIIHRIGFDQQDQKYILPEEIEEELDINTMNWVIGENTSTIFIPGYDGTQNRLAHIEIKAMLKNDLTSSFATTVYVDRGIALAKEGIEIEAATTYATKTELGETETELSGKIDVADGKIDLITSKTLKDVLNEDDEVTAASIALAINEDDTSNIKLDADKVNINGVISANGNFQVDLEGNMTCNDANINGDLVTANGVLTNLVFPGEMWGWDFENAYGGEQAGFLGYNVDTNNWQSTAVLKSFLNFSIRIPPNFIVKSAKIYLRHTPMTWGSGAPVFDTTAYYSPNDYVIYNDKLYKCTTSHNGAWNSSHFTLVYNNIEATGYCRNVKLYNVSNLGQTGFGLYASYMYIGGSYPTFTRIGDTNLSFSNSQFEEKATDEFKSIFTTSESPQTYNVCVKSSDNPSYSNWETAYNQIGPYTGIMTGYAEIIGYLK